MLSAISSIDIFGKINGFILYFIDIYMRRSKGGTGGPDPLSEKKPTQKYRVSFVFIQSIAKNGPYSAWSIIIHTSHFFEIIPIICWEEIALISSNLFLFLDP